MFVDNPSSPRLALINQHHFSIKSLAKESSSFRLKWCDLRFRFNFRQNGFGSLGLHSIAQRFFSDSSCHIFLLVVRGYSPFIWLSNPTYSQTGYISTSFCVSFCCQNAEQPIACCFGEFISIGLPKYSKIPQTSGSHERYAQASPFPCAKLADPYLVFRHVLYTQHKGHGRMAGTR